MDTRATWRATVTPRPSHIPNHYERSALTKLASGRDLGLSQLSVGRKTIGKLLDKGWIERAGSAYRITEGGKAALRAKGAVIGSQFAALGLKARGKC